MAAVLPWLLVGDKSTAKDRALLRRLNVRYIINCTPSRTDGGVANFFEKEPCFEYHRVLLRDLNTESVLPHLPSVVEFLQRARVRADGLVLVHCNEGKSRSCALTMGYLILSHSVTLTEALEMVRAVRCACSPSLDDTIRAWPPCLSPLLHPISGLTLSHPDLTVSGLKRS